MLGPGTEVKVTRLCFIRSSLVCSNNKLKTNVWPRIIENHVVRSYELVPNLNGDFYLDFLQNGLYDIPNV